MKNAILLIAFIVSAISSFSQSLFFNNLNNTTWIATVKSKDASIKDAKEVALNKLSVPMDSLKFNATLWNFNNGQLTITLYNYQYKTASTAATYNYQLNADKDTLTIALPNDSSQQFEVGINSVGNFALLLKCKEKRESGRSSDNAKNH